MPLNIFQVGEGTLKLHSANGLGNLTSVLEGHTEEGTTSLCSVSRAGRGGRVADLESRDPELAFSHQALPWVIQ